MTTHRITSIPVTSPDGTIVGKAVLEVDSGGNVRAHMTLDSSLGRELMKSMESGIVEGLSFGPVVTPAMKSSADHFKANLTYAMGYVPREFNSPGTDVRFVDAVSPHPTTENVSLGTEEIERRFGFHKASIEGPNATAKKHADVRANFKSFAKWFDRNTPPGREKDIAMERLEEASMWFHKGIAKSSAAPLRD